MRNDVPGFRLGGSPAPNQNPMQTLNGDVSDSWAEGSSSSVHQSLQTCKHVRETSSVQTYKLVSGFWKGGSSASFHYPMQTDVQTSSSVQTHWLACSTCAVAKLTAQFAPYPYRHKIARIHGNKRRCAVHGNCLGRLVHLSILPASTFIASFN